MDERDTDELIMVRTWAELFALPGFIEGAVAPGLMKTGRIAARYSMAAKDGEKPCGLKDCRTAHRNGFVIRLPDGRLSHVGKDCGRKEFGAERWEVETKRFSAVRARRAATEALATARSALLDAMNEPHIADQAIEARARFLLAAWDKAPAWLRESVENRASDMDPKIMGERMQTQKEANEERFRKADDDAKVKGDAKRRLIRFEKGRIAGLKAVHRLKRFDVVVDRRCREVLRAARAAYDEITATTKSLDEARDRLMNARNDALDAAMALEAFVAPANLSLLLELRVARERGAKQIALIGDAIVVE